MPLLHSGHKLCRSCLSASSCRSSWATLPPSLQSQAQRLASSSSGSKPAGEARPKIDDGDDRLNSPKTRPKGRKADAGSTKTSKASPKPKESSARNERNKTRAPNEPAPPSTTTSAGTVRSAQDGLPTAQLSRGQSPLRSPVAKPRVSAGTVKLDPSALPRLLGPRIRFSSIDYDTAMPRMWSRPKSSPFHHCSSFQLRMIPSDELPSRQRPFPPSLYEGDKSKLDTAESGSQVSRSASSTTPSPADQAGSNLSPTLKKPPKWMASGLFVSTRLTPLSGANVSASVGSAEEVASERLDAQGTNPANTGSTDVLPTPTPTPTDPLGVAPSRPNTLSAKHPNSPIVHFGVVATKSGVSKFAVERRRARTRFKAAVDMVVNRSEGGRNLVSPNFTYLSTVLPEALTAPFETICFEVGKGLRRMSEAYQTQGQPRHQPQQSSRSRNPIEFGRSPAGYQGNGNPNSDRDTGRDRSLKRSDAGQGPSKNGGGGRGFGFARRDGR